MKKQFLKLASLLFLFTSITQRALAYSFESGGIYYNITSSTNMTAAVTFYDKKDNVYGGTVSIPEKVTYQGKTYTVTAIGDYAFVGCTNLKTVKYSSKLTSIGNNAFSGCNGMTSVVIPAHITSIGNFAFNGCTSITGVTIEEGETTLKLGYSNGSNGKGLFYDSPLYSVFIGRPLSYQTTGFGYSPFAQIQTLTKVHFGNPVKSIPNYLLYGCTSFKIFQYNSQCKPTSVGNYAFSGCTSLTESDIVLPETVTSIGDGAFSRCTSLSSYTIPNHIVTVGSYAFQNCDKLKNVVIKPSVTSIGNFAFNGCTSITGVTIEEGETTLKLGYSNGSNGKGLFYDSPLYSVFIGRPLNYTTTGFGYSPFAQSQTLTKVRFGNPVTKIYDYLFYGCTELTTIEYNSQCKPTTVGQYAFYGCKSLTWDAVALPQSVNTINNNAFQNCTKFTNLVIKPSVTSIGNFAFNGCTSITGVTIEEGETTLKLGYSNGSNGKGLFYDSPLYSVFIGRPLSYSTTGFGYSPFAQSQTLTKVRFGNPVTKIYDYLFYGCTELTTIEYDEECAPTDVGKYTFYNCKALIGGDNIIPASVKAIGERAFSGCSKLENITIPAKVTSIGQYGFADCTKLARVTSQATTPPTIKENCFSGDTYSSATLYAPDKIAYAKAVGWKNFLNVVETGSPTPVKDIEMSYVGTNRTYQDESQGIRPTGYRVLSLYWNDIKNSICQSFGINNATFEQHYNAEPIRDSNMEYQQYEKNASGQYVARTSGNYIGVISIQADMESSNDRLIWTLANADVQKLYSQWDRKSEKTFELSTAIKYEDIHGSHSHYGDVYIEFSTKVTFKPYSATEMQGVVLNAKYFPDANFRAALATILKISDGDEITDAMIQQTTTLSISSKSIADLTGIEHFTALTRLFCSGNQLTSLDVSKNTALTELSCGGNQLTSLDVSKNTALEYLSCDGNPLTSLDVSKNAALTGLYCEHNQLNSLDVSGCTALVTLWCFNNQLTLLNVSKNTALTWLYCNNNQLTALDVSQNTALTWLYCRNNQLTALDVSKNTKLTKLYCYGNQLTSLDVSKNTKLSQLDCFGNQIKGDKMQALVISLPTVTNGEFYVIDTEDSKEQNVCTKSQVKIAKDKGWKVYDWNGGSPQEYAGSDDTTTSIDNSQSAIDNSDDAWYSLDGKKLAGEPTKKGIYIRNGRKVVK